MKRILFLTVYASPYRVRFFDELGKSAQVTVLFARPCGDVHHRDVKWFEPGQGNFQEVQLKSLCTIGGRQLCPDVIDWLKKPYDAIVICGYSSPTAILAIHWLQRKKIPFYMEVDGGLIRQEWKGKYLFKRSLVRKADQWLSTGRYTTEFLVHYGAEESRVHVYPFTSLFEKDILPVVPSPEEKQALKQELGIPEKRMVLAVGRFVPGKGFDILMQAACSLEKDVGVYIVGGEPTEEYLNMRSALGLENVHFVGFQKKEALSRYYKAADLFVLPTRGDVWGLVINEAMACGLPVITTDRCIAGLELVEEGVNGSVISVDDTDALAGKMKQILSSDLEKMGTASLKKIRFYTIENMAKTHMAIFEKDGR